MVVGKLAARHTNHLPPKAPSLAAFRARSQPPFAAFHATLAPLEGDWWVTSSDSLPPFTIAVASVVTRIFRSVDGVDDDLVCNVNISDAGAARVLQQLQHGVQLKFLTSTIGVCICRV